MKEILIKIKFKVIENKILKVYSNSEEIFSSELGENKSIEAKNIFKLFDHNEYDNILFDANIEFDASEVNENSIVGKVTYFKEWLERILCEVNGLLAEKKAANILDN